MSYKIGDTVALVAFFGLLFTLVYVVFHHSWHRCCCWRGSGKLTIFLWMLRPRINACLCPRQERSLWRCRSAWLMKALPRTGWEQLLVVAGGKLVAGAQWRWDGASYLLAPHRRSSTPRSGVATEHEKKREKNERHGEKRKHKRFLLPTATHIYMKSGVNPEIYFKPKW